MEDRPDSRSLRCVRPCPFVSRHWARGFTFIELLAVITIASIVAAILLPVLARAQQAAMRSHCLNNMRELGIMFHMFANEHQGQFPPGAPNGYWGEPQTAPDPARFVRNNYIFDPTALMPAYTDSLKVLYCRAADRPVADPEMTWYGDVTFTPPYLNSLMARDQRNEERLKTLVRNEPRPDPDCVTCQMYTYFPYTVADEEQALFLRDELDRRMAAGEIDFMRKDLAAPGGHAPGGGTTFFRMRFGIERVFITDINNPAAAAASEASIPVLLDSFSLGTSYHFNHIYPLGGNVLFMDGHVEFRRLGDARRNFPYTVDLVEWMRLNVYTNAPLAGFAPWCSNRPPEVPFEPRYRYYPHDPMYSGLYF